MFLFRFLSDVMAVISVKCSRHKLLLCCTACATFLCLTLVSVVDRWKPQSIPQLAPMSVNDPPILSSTQVRKVTFVALSNFVFLLCVIRWHQPVIVSFTFTWNLVIDRQLFSYHFDIYRKIFYNSTATWFILCCSYKFAFYLEF